MKATPKEILKNELQIAIGHKEFYSKHPFYRGDKHKHQNQMDRINAKIKEIKEKLLNL